MCLFLEDKLINGLPEDIQALPDVGGALSYFAAGEGDGLLIEDI